MVIVKAFLIGFLCVILVVILGLVELYTQVARYRNYWQRQNATVEKVEYVALGDSAAQGLGATHPSKGYVGVIAKELGVKPINLSKSGAKIEDVLQDQLPQLEKLQLTDETVITIEIGANDIVSGFDPAKFEAEMGELMDRLPKQAVISDMPYFGSSRYRAKEVNVKVANEIMYRLANERGFILASLYERTRQNGGPKIFAVDWFHPSNLSYRDNWAHVFLERIDREQ